MMRSRLLGWVSSLDLRRLALRRLAPGILAPGILALALAATVGGGAPMAADLGGDYRGGSIKDEPYYAPPFSWTGTYAGLQLGYGWADTDARSGLIGAFDQSYGYEADGFLGGAHIGFNFQNGSVVYGLEGDLDFADLKETSVGTLGDRHTTDIDWMGSLRGRLGFAAGRNLIYVTGGWAFGDVSIRSESGAVAYSDIRNGWTLGGGLEHAFTDNMTARLEYRYTDFGGYDGRNGVLGDDSDVTLHTLRAGVSVKF